MTILGSNVTKNIKNLASRNSTASLKILADAAKDKRAAKEGTVIGTAVGTSKGGFTSLSASVNETLGKTDEPVVAILGEDVPGITVKKTSTQASSLSTLTGKTVSDGLLNAVIASGNPNGINAVLVDTLGTTQSQANAALKEVSAEPTFVESSITEDIGGTLVNDAEKISKKLMETLKNPFASTQIFGSLGLPFGNILGAITSLLVDRKPQQAIGEVVPSLPINAEVPEIAPANIVDADGSTNFRKVVEEDKPLPSNVQNSIPTYVIGGDSTKFTYPLPDNYVFTEVGGVEELEQELRNESRNISTAVVRWSESYISDFSTASSLADQHIRFIQQSTDARTLVAYTQRGGSFIPGILWHYVIRKDGVIQRGRPLSIGTYDPSKAFKGLSEHTIQIGFIAGYDSSRLDPGARLTSQSISPLQWKAFNSFLDSFYKAIPGGQVYGWNELVDTSSASPGFPVSSYISSRYGKINLDANKQSNVLSKSKIATSVAPSVKEPSRTISREDSFFKTPEIESSITTPINTTTGDREPPTDEQMLNASILYNNRKRDLILAKIELDKEQALTDLRRGVDNSTTLEIRNLQAQVELIEEDLIKIRKDLTDQLFIYDDENEEWITRQDKDEIPAKIRFNLELGQYGAKNTKGKFKYLPDLESAIAWTKE